jgi:nucleotide-binding universal stress UspA family protein
VEFALELRLERGGDPYLVAWVMLVYRAWVAFGARLPGHAYSDEDVKHARTELHSALFALGVASAPSDVPPFIDELGELPWKEAVSTIDAVDARTVAFVVLVDHLSQAALTRQQRMRLLLPMTSCFVSYARADEAFVRELVDHLEAKGADVWLDLNAITLGKPLDASLRAAVADTGFLFLVATDAADQSSYVRLEAATAIERGLRIVPVVRGAGMPAGFEALIASKPAAFDPVIDASAGMDAFASALARLRRTPEEQVRWLTSQPLYAQLRDRVARARGAQVLANR